MTNCSSGKLWLALAASAATAVLYGCGGGSSSTGTAANSPAPTPVATGAASYVGTISGLGSIVVNGMRFETIGANVVDSDDVYGSTGYTRPLDLGMTVALNGDADDKTSLGKAKTVRVVGGARGYMLSVDTKATPNTLTLRNGQTVLVDAKTVYRGKTDTVTAVASLADLRANDALDVQGLLQANGDLLATRVVAYNTTDFTNFKYKYAARGTLTAISGTTYTVKTSSAQTLSVNCAAAPACEISTPDKTALAVGDAVRILAVDDTKFVGTTLQAAKIQSLKPKHVSDFPGLPADYAKIKGALTKDSAGAYVVSGVKITGIDAKLAAITIGTVVEIKGTWVGTAGTELNATVVEIEGERSACVGTDCNNNKYKYRNEFYGALLWDATLKSFSVQGVKLDLSGANCTVISGQTTSACGTLVASDNGKYVEAKGSLNAGVLLVTTIEVKATTKSTDPKSPDPVVGGFEVYGQISGLTTTTIPNATFTLTPKRGGVFSAQAVQNVVVQGTPANNSYVEAKGYMDKVNGKDVFMVVKIEVKNGYQED